MPAFVPVVNSLGRAFIHDHLVNLSLMMTTMMMMTMMMMMAMVMMIIWMMMPPRCVAEPLESSGGKPDMAGPRRDVLALEHILYTQ